MEQEAKAYKQQTILDAQGEVAQFSKLLPEYQAAPKVTRERMYLSAMEKIYSNTSKVMVDVDGGNNMMYLPLDKIMQQSANYPTPKAVNVNSTVNNQPRVSNNTSSTSSSSRDDRFGNGRN